LLCEEGLEYALANFTRLFFSARRMRGCVKPNLQNVGRRNSVVPYRSPKNGFPIGRYSDVNISGPIVFHRETNPVERVQREPFQVDVRRNAADESIP
jgi:hypothetical protein